MKKCLSLSKRRRYYVELSEEAEDAIFFLNCEETSRLRGRLRIEQNVRLELREDDGEDFRQNDSILEMIREEASLTAKVGDIRVKIEYSPFLLSVYHMNVCVCVCKIYQKEGKVSFFTEIKGINHLYGLAERASSSRLTDGQTYYLYNTDEFGLAQGTDKPLYGSIPFVIGVRGNSGIGILLRNESKVTVHVERRRWPRSSRQYWSHDVGNVEFIFFPGKDALHIRQNFLEFIGVTPLPPLFSLGYHQCRWNYNDQEDVLMVDTNLREASIPCDVIWLDIEHTNGKRYLTWDKDKFNPSQLIDIFRKNERHLVVIVDPHLKEDEQYKIYQEARDAGYLIKNEDGSTFIGKCWSDNSAWVDFISEDASAWWSDKICFYLKEYGCCGESNNLWIWNDMNEPSVFNCPNNQMKPTALHVNGIKHREIHNIYGLRMVMATWNGIMKACERNLRPFLLSRSFYTGSQKYGAIWTGDSLCSWDHLRVSISMMLSLSICGIDFCGADVGGFFGDPELELLCRWYQLGAFQPFFRAHAHIDSQRREPYLLGEPYKTVIKNAICLRYKLLSYWYLCFWKAETLRIPVVSPIWMVFPDYHFKHKDDAYMIGNNMLIRPVVSALCLSITLILPGSSNSLWYQYCYVSSCWKIRKADQKLKLAVNIDCIPVFYTGGSCIFTKEGSCTSTYEWRHLPYNIVIFPDDSGTSSGLLYVDDYTSFKYKDNEEYGLYRCTFSCQSCTLSMESVHVNLSKQCSSCSEISKITIIKSNDSSTSRWKHVFLDNSDTEEDFSIIQFDDRIEITNIKLDVCASWTITMK